MRPAVIRAAAVLALTLGAALAASAQPEAVPPQQPVQPVAVLPPTLTPPAVTHSPEDGLAVPQVARDLTGDATEIITLDLAGLDQSEPNRSLLTGRGPFGQFWDAVVYWFQTIVTTVANALTPPSPVSLAKSLNSKDVDSLWQLVGDAGYKLSEITTDVGVVPDVAFQFRYIRELSDGDINWLERRLARHARIHQDPISLLQRMIIDTLLNINSSDTYFVSELRIKLLPLPNVQFTLQPWDHGLSPESERLVRTLQGKPVVRHKPAEEDSRY